MGEGSQLQQRSLYLKGIGAYELDHLPRLDRVGKAIYSAFEMAFAWFVLDYFAPLRLMKSVGIGTQRRT